MVITADIIILNKLVEKRRRESWEWITTSQKTDTPKNGESIIPVRDL